jgi:hypothetical protein
MHPDPYHLARTNLGCPMLQMALIGSMTHLNPYSHMSPTYGAHQYPQPYGGTSYYPPPTHLHSYHVATPPPLGGSSPVPIMHPFSQPSTISPSTLAYNHSHSVSDSPSYTPYGSSPQNNLYFPFPGPPQPVAPPPGQPHVSVNFVQPSPIQQVHIFKQLNTENPAHQPNNAKNKGKNRNNNNSGLGRNNPQQICPVGGNQNPQGDNNNNQL